MPPCLSHITINTIDTQLIIFHPRKSKSIIHVPLTIILNRPTFAPNLPQSVQMQQRWIVTTPGAHFEGTALSSPHVEFATYVSFIFTNKIQLIYNISDPNLLLPLLNAPQVPPSPRTQTPPHSVSTPAAGKTAATSSPSLTSLPKTYAPTFVRLTTWVWG